MIEASEVTALVIDHGLFVPVAQRLAKTFKRVLYYCPHEVGFPTINGSVIGDGFPHVEKCEDIWDVKNEVSVFVFPDIGFSGLQLELESQGFPVWGSRKADKLETHRQMFQRVLGEVGLQVAPFIVIKGLPDLRAHLKDNENKFIKISKYRGSLETFHWRSMDLDEGVLDVLAVRFGPAGKKIPFMVFDAIETPLEIGGDTYCVDGQWPDLMLHGDEAKDKSYLGAVTKRDEMPDQIKEVLAAFAPVLEKYRYRNQWSMELRILDDKAYFLDPCCRGGLPSTGSQLAMWKNFPEIVWAGANGQMIQPEPAAEFCAESVITTKVDPDQWTEFYIGPEYEGKAIFGSSCMIDGKVVQPADKTHTGNEVGWLVATGNTLEEVIDIMHKQADGLPDGLDADTDSLIDMLKEVAEGEKEGIKFADKIPAPETALNL